MLITISPAKTLDYESAFKAPQTTRPRMLDDSQELVTRLRQLSALDIAELMKVSNKIAELNFQRYHDWHTPFTKDNARPAIFAFKGDVYTGLDIDTFGQDDLRHAQKHLRILSGLYGVLRPLDLMQPYRLEMGTRLPTARGGNLYEFWGDTITRLLNKDLKASGSDTLINLASNEYFKAVRPDILKGRIITPVFKELRGDTFKIVGIHAKRARGLMSRWILLNRIEKPEQIKRFSEAGYLYSEPMSSETEWVFTRAE